MPATTERRAIATPDIAATLPSPAIPRTVATRDLAWPGLEGLRGIAALVVVLSHTSKHFPPGLDWNGAGKIGVWLFFTLSAFILTHQMLATGAPLRPANLLRYHLRRFFRIYPMFVVGLCAWLALDDLPTSRLLPALTLQHAPDHFWTVPVEYQYYLLVPVVAWSFLRLCRRSLRLLCVGIGALSIAAVVVPLPDLMGWRFLPVFLAGSFGACLVFVRGDVPPLRHVGAWGLACAMLAGLAIPGVMRTLGIDTLVDVDGPRNRHELYGWLFLPVVLAAIGSARWQQVLGAQPFRLLGRWSFSLYLLHPVVIELLTRMELPMPSTITGVSCVAASIAVAAAAHTLVEHPGRQLGYRLTNRTARGHATRADRESVIRSDMPPAQPECENSLVREVTTSSNPRSNNDPTPRCRPQDHRR